MTIWTKFQFVFSLWYLLFFLNNYMCYMFYNSVLCSVLLYNVDLFALLLFWFFCCFYFFYLEWTFSGLFWVFMLFLLFLFFYLECIFSGLVWVFILCWVFCIVLFLLFKTLTLQFINSVLFLFCNLNWFFVCEGRLLHIWYWPQTKQPRGYLAGCIFYCDTSLII